ncbi:MAG: efflux RND transporter periplasmic adaptor subunit [Lachnospiraceae bacterium]|nr:efflux RND transporter periplasmic adaptor subunit [Lachnospiraceae bacterium]
MRKRIIVLTQAVALSSVLLLSGCAQDKELEVKDNTVIVKTAEAEIGSLNTDGLYIGTIENTEEVDVVSKVSGTLTEVNAVVGDTVSAGSVLAKFDDTSAKLDLEGAQVGVESARKSLESAENSLEKAQANYNSTMENGASKLGPEHEASDYKSQMDIKGMEEDMHAQEEKIKNYKETTLDEAEHDVKKYKKKKRNAVTEQEENEYESKLDSAEKSLTSAEQTLKDMESKYDSMVIDYQTAVGQREKNNGELYESEQRSVANSLQVAQKDVDSASIGVGSAKAGVDSASNKVDTASYQLSLYTVKAPMSGVIEQVNVEKNNYFAAGNVSFVISNPDSRCAVFHVPDTVAAELSAGQSVSVNSGAKNYEGKITEVGVAVDDTGLFQVKAAIFNAADLSDGVNIKVNTIIHRSENKVVIPTNAVYFKDNQAFVYVAENGHAVKKDVSVDIYGDEKTSISEGLAKGDEVITTWSGSLNDGAEIKVEGKGETQAESKDSSKEQGA